MTDERRFEPEPAPSPDLEARLERWFSAELTRSRADVQGGQLRKHRVGPVRSARTSRRVAWSALLGSLLALVVIVAIAGGLLSGAPTPSPTPGVSVASPTSVLSSASPAASPGIQIGANGLPTSIGGEPVLTVPAAVDRAAHSTDSTPFLVAGWLSYVKAACPAILPQKPPILRTGMCGDWPSLLGAVPYEPNGQQNLALLGSTDLWPAFLTVDPPRSDPVLANQAAVFRVHTHDPAANACSAALRDQCRQAVVADATLWIEAMDPPYSAIPTGQADPPTPDHNPGFWATGSMSVSRRDATATLLPDGQVLVAGGDYTTTTGFHELTDHPLASAELYDWLNGRFSPTGSMSIARTGHTATLLANGQVLITGGTQGQAVTASAELFDPATGVFRPTGSMTGPRVGQTATLLGDGRVLIVGGSTSGEQATASAELYDPRTGTFSAAGSMSTPRLQDTATLLADGRVLVAGGQLPGASTGSGILASAEVYDPATGLFSPTGPMTLARVGHAATLLNDGRVLVTGGATNGNGSVFTASAEVYDPASGTFSRTGSMAVKRVGQTQTLLWGGWVVVAGGDELAIARGNGIGEVYDPIKGTFSRAGTLTMAPFYGTATFLPDGTVLIAGGDTASADRYQEPSSLP